MRRLRGPRFGTDSSTGTVSRPRGDEKANVGLATAWRVDLDAMTRTQLKALIFIMENGKGGAWIKRLPGEEEFVYRDRLVRRARELVEEEKRRHGALWGATLLAGGAATIIFYLHKWDKFSRNTQLQAATNLAQGRQQSMWDNYRGMKLGTNMLAKMYNPRKNDSPIITFSQTFQASFVSDRTGNAIVGTILAMFSTLAAVYGVSRVIEELRKRGLGSTNERILRSVAVEAAAAKEGSAGAGQGRESAPAVPRPTTAADYVSIRDRCGTKTTKESCVGECHWYSHRRAPKRKCSAAPFVKLMAKGGGGALSADAKTEAEEDARGGRGGLVSALERAAPAPPPRANEFDGEDKTEGDGSGADKCEGIRKAACDTSPWCRWRQGQRVGKGSRAKSKSSRAKSKSSRKGTCRAVGRP
jgi:hypothetical protein